jgi:microcystin degradation protein MlrC
MSFKIALVGIYHESNTFAPQPNTLLDFHNGHYLKGAEIRSEYQQAHHEIGGMLEVMDQYGIEVVPIMYAEATPGGTVSSEAYKLLLNDMMQELEKTLPVDGCLVAPHGAGVSEDFPDLDGNWLSLLRERIGKSIPIIGTLDLHANVSPLMVSSTNALVSYKENPHVDQRQRGKEAANLLVQCLQAKINPVQVLVQVPVAISIEQQLTNNEPCKSLYAYAKELSQQPGMLSLSIQLGFPYADVEEMGTSIIVVSDDNLDQALETAKRLESYIIDNRESFVGPKNDIPTSLMLINKSEKPVLLLDMGDNVGGGGPGNNICILEALEEDMRYKYFVCIYDPGAVIEASKYQPGDTFDLFITGTGKHGIKVHELKVNLIQICDGDFTEESARHGGQVNFRMGKIAMVATDQGGTVMLTSLRVMPFSLRQLTSFNIDPAGFDAIVAKGVNAPIAAYSPVCPSIIQVNTPGVTQADMTLFDFRNRRKPLFPFEINV